MLTALNILLPPSVIYFSWFSSNSYPRKKERKNNWKKKSLSDFLANNLSRQHSYQSPTPSPMLQLEAQLENLPGIHPQRSTLKQLRICAARDGKCSGFPSCNYPFFFPCSNYQSRHIRATNYPKRQAVWLMSFFLRFVGLREKVHWAYSKVGKHRDEKLLLSVHRLIIKTLLLLEESEIGHKCSTWELGWRQSGQSWSCSWKFSNSKQAKDLLKP